ncbi:MAG: ribosomal protein S18-alanine N-acetyltransferase [Caldimicrobium sp.]|nr:ribosomal protein S18-alanine N-acetyltransferase [Caldimicrobium sp.]MCX7613621.1 ribosomal protein S18-alanine N-acetyltransferase [Caldimicrobium sp.]MDW8183100.1 ribosomal protein S18-alanine N-acetyltransferase [Caldimicrobium sp.]
MWKEIEVSILNDLSEVESLSSIEREAFGDIAWSTDILEGELKNPFSKALVLLIDGRTVGYLLYRVIEKEGELLRIAIKPEFQGMGCGKLLINSLLKKLAKDGINGLYLEVWEKNEQARKLYQKTGFKFLYKRKDYYKLGEHADIFYISLREACHDQGCH